MDNSTTPADPVTELWEKALGYVRAEISSNVAYKTYIAPAVPISFTDDTFTIAVNISLAKLMLEKYHRDLIEKSLSRTADRAVKLEIVISDNIAAFKRERELELQAQADGQNSSNSEGSATYINPRYTFDKFVVGSSNIHAYNMALSLAQHPLKKEFNDERARYNPLFLYGSSGLGKTHLMLAMGNYVLENHPDLKVTYVTSEKFTNDMIDALRGKNSNEFRRKYRETDFLLIDDIQFIEGKEGTQEEFFHTFNELYNNNSQIVITSDRTPQELVTIEKRLRTRFSSGMITDIGVPEYETRMAILQKKAEVEDIHIGTDVFNYIAERVKTNVRELEGALTKIIAYSKMSEKEINIQFAEESLKRILPEDKIIKITHQEIKEKVCTYYNVSMEELIGSSRTKEVATARQVAMYLCRKLTDMNNVRIGMEFGNKDRTTVTHNVAKIETEIEKNEDIKNAVEFITKDLQTI